MTYNYDVIIIGGGIIGNSAAAHLANENLKIAVVGSSELGIPASIAAAGLFQLQLGELENPALKPFCINSYEYFLKFYEEIKSDPLLENINLGFNQCGSLYLIFSNMEIAQKESELRALKDFNPKPYYVDKIELAKHETLLTKDLLGAYYYPFEGYINNPKFLKALSSYCTNRKVDYIDNEVIEINSSKETIESITLNNGKTLKANKYILCNGAWANKLVNKVFNIKENVIQGVKGEILQLLVKGNMPVEKVIFCQNGYIVPRPKTNHLEHDSLIIGGTYEETSINENRFVFNNSPQAISSLTELLQKLLPGCKDLPIQNMWSGVRPKTKDSLPILGKTEEIKNLYFGLGHYRNGILMGPLSGKIISDLVLENRSKYNIEEFSINRFLKKATLH